MILLEDDLILLGLMADGLRADRYTVVETDTLAEASAALQAVEGNAVLIADRSVGKDGAINGFQLAADALEAYPALRVIYITGTHIAIRRRQLSERERGLLKPFAMSQLVTALHELGAS